MAEHKVSTWEDFVNAYTAEAAAGETERTIEIMADLDCNDMPFSNYIISPKNVEMIINGNQHNIWNISTESVVNGALIRGGDAKPFTWNKTNFGNINRIENAGIFAGYSTTYSIVFNDCTFVGKGFSLSNNAIFNKCAVTWTGSRGEGVAFPYSVFNNCWIHYEGTRLKNVNNQEFANLNSCYVEGTIKGVNETITSGGYIVTNVSNSVINIESNLTYASVARTPNTAVTVYNTTKMPNATVPEGSANFLVGVTDDQMKDANYLSSIGFNIITG